MEKINQRVNKLEEQVKTNTSSIKVLFDEIKFFKQTLLRELKLINTKLDNEKKNNKKTSFWQIILYLLAGGMIAMLISMIIFG